MSEHTYEGTLTVPPKSTLQGPQSTMPTSRPTALRLPRNTSRSTKKSAFQGLQSTAPATKAALQGPQSIAPATICHDICTSRFTSRSPAKSIRSKRTSKDHVKMPNRSFRLRLPPISEAEPHHDSPHLPRNQSTPKTTAMSKIYYACHKVCTST